MSQHILVVEDDEMIQAFVKLHLENEGYRVSIAGTGADMFVGLATGDVSLILLDLGLPDGDGLTLAQQVREQSDIPIIILTARKSIDDRLMGLGLGADDYLTKPIDPRELSLRILNVLGRSSDQDGPPSPTPVVPPPPIVPPVTKAKRGTGMVFSVIVLLLAAGAGVYWVLTPNPQEQAEVPMASTSTPATTSAPPSQPTSAVEKKMYEGTIRSKAEILGYGWVLKTKCDPIPDVKWWKFRTHESIAGYVMRKHSGDWKPYVEIWFRRLVKLQDIAERNSTAVTQTGVSLKGEELAKYIEQTIQRLAVIRCLADEAMAANAG